MSTSRALSNLVKDQNILTADQRVTTSLANIRAQVATLAATTLVKPETYGAIANDPTKAAANRAALQAWLDASNLGMLWHNPRNVYYVNTGATPLTIKKRLRAAFIRLKPVIQAAGQTLLEFASTRGVVYPMTSAAVTRGQRVFTLAALTTPPAVGTKVFIEAGQDPYQGAQAGWQAVATVTEIDNSNMLAPTVTLDRGSPKPWAAPGAAVQRMTAITSDAGENSQIDYLDIDESGQALTLAKAVSFVATRDILIKRYKHSAARAQTIHIVASENITITDYYNRLPLARLGGGVNLYKDVNTRFGYAKAETKQESTMFTLGGGSIGASCEHFDIHKYGTGAWSQAAILSNDGAEALQVGVMEVIDDLDLGFRLALQTNNGEAPTVRLFFSDKDPLHLGCLPGYLDTKSVLGKLAILEKEIQFPATPAGVTAKDYFLGRFWAPRVELYASDFNGYTADLYTPPYNAAGSTRTRLNVAYEAAPESSGTPTPTGQWTTWLDEKNAAQLASIGYAPGFNASTVDFERWLRFGTLAAKAAGTFIRFKFHVYPMKAVFAPTNT